MVARLQNKVTTPAEDNRPRVHNFQSREDEDPFSDLSLLDPADFDQKEDVNDAVRDIMERAKANGLPAEYHSGLEEQVMSHFDIFRTGLSSGEPAALPPLKIQLALGARPVKVQLRNYSQEQRKFLKSSANS